MSQPEDGRSPLSWDICPSFLINFFSLSLASLAYTHTHTHTHTHTPVGLESGGKFVGWPYVSALPMPVPGMEREREREREKRIMYAEDLAVMVLAQFSTDPYLRQVVLRRNKNTLAHSRTAIACK